jgi:hypothetical protein
MQTVDCTAALLPVISISSHQPQQLNDHHDTTRLSTNLRQKTSLRLSPGSFRKSRAGSPQDVTASGHKDRCCCCGPQLACNYKSASCSVNCPSPPTLSTTLCRPGRIFITSIRAARFDPPPSLLTYCIKPLYSTGFAMKSLSQFLPFTILALTAFSKPITLRDVDPELIPPFDFQRGLNPTGMCLSIGTLCPWGSDTSLDGLAGTGDCDGAVKGANGQPIKIPCSCPPDRQTFVQVSIYICTHPTPRGLVRSNHDSQQCFRN